MSIWTRIIEALSALAAGEGLAALFERLRTPRERSVGFAIAAIALSAKMAKADGLVTRNEVTAFREVFEIAEEDEAAAARVYNLARQDVAGYEDYARRIRRLFGGEHPPLFDLLDGLFHIAMADGSYHPAEDGFLARVATIFGLTDREFRAVRTRFVPGSEPDPWDVLGLDPGASPDEVRRAWRTLVRETHPDRMIAHGLPPEAVRLAEKRLIAINRAYEAITGACIAAS